VSRAAATEYTGNTSAGTLAMTEGTLSEDTSARPKTLNTLLDSSSIRCDFYAAQGANWAGGKAVVHGVAYQGSPERRR
jgi:hypothetical protein